MTSGGLHERPCEMRTLNLVPARRYNLVTPLPGPHGTVGTVRHRHDGSHCIRTRARERTPVWGVEVCVESERAIATVMTVPCGNQQHLGV